MKIKKLVESALLEADDETVDSTDSAAEIASAIENQTAGVVSEKEADAMAAEVKAVGDAVEGDVYADTPAIAEIKDADEDLHIENNLTEYLQKNYINALRARRMNKSTKPFNILIVGLPGSGKTASFADWAKFASPKVNVTYVNAKNNDLEAFINGYTVRVPGDDKNKVGTVGQAYGSNLDSLDRPNSVLFLDEYNRQTKAQIRASLLTLINEHYVMGTGEHHGLQGVRHFPNFLFTVAAINPTTAADKDAAHLNSAETTRFTKIFAYDSNPAETVKYLKKSYPKQMELLNKNSPDYKDDLLVLLKSYDLGLFIAEKPEFRYDDKNDIMEVDDLQSIDSAGRPGQLWNQRLFTQGLDACMGDIDDFKNWYHDDILILKKDVDMLDKILMYYEVPSDYDLAHKYFPEAEKLFEKPTTAATGNNEEDDEDLFAGTNAQDADNDLESTIAGWEDALN